MKPPVRRTKPATGTPVQLRHRAEVHLWKQQKQQRSQVAKTKSGLAVLVADSQRQFHELQVHQVELEMQNLELQKVREELEASLEQYTDLYDFAPVGFFTLAPDSTVQQANLTGASLVGVERSRLVGRCFDQLVAAELRPVFHAFLRAVFAGQTKQSGDFELMQPGQPPRIVNVKAQRSLGGDSCRAVVADITERKRGEDNVRVSEIRYRRLFETAHDGVLLLDPATRQITDANPFMTALLGYSHDQFVGKELFEIGLLNDKSASQTMFQKLKQNHEVRYEDLPLKRKTGQHQEVEVVANLYQENGHAVIQCNIRDITARKVTEHDLAEKARLLDLSNDAIIVRDMKGYIRYWNHGAEELYGWSRKEAMGKLSHRLLRTKFPVPLKQMTEELHRTDRWIGELIHTRRDGQRITVLARKTLDRDRQGRPIVVLENITDITARKQAEAAQRRSEVLAASNLRLKQEIARRKESEKSLRKSEQHQRHLFDQSRLQQEQLRHLSRQVLRAQEEERKRISRELHDVIAQTLTGINLQLASLKKSVGASHKGFGKNITRTQALVARSVQLVHDFARELRPAVLDDLGLIPALHTYMKSFTTQTGVRTQLTAFAGVEHLDTAQRTILFRVAQEALTNVAKHAQASRVAVTIQKLPDAIAMTIGDDGKSFRAQDAWQAHGGDRLGLLGMRERVEMIGGNFTVESTPGKGTTIGVQLPLGKVVRGGGALPESVAKKFESL